MKGLDKMQAKSGSYALVTFREGKEVQVQEWYNLITSFF